LLFFWDSIPAVGVIAVNIFNDPSTDNRTVPPSAWVHLQCGELTTKKRYVMPAGG
jgi:hypothetical protein